MTKKTALYIRVSTDAQREEGYSIDAQKEMLSAFCVSKRIENYEFFIDGGFSGSNLERPEMKRLIAEAKEKKICRVIVYKLDRLSRSQRDTLYLIEEIFNPNGIDFVSMNESMDTSTPLGRLMLGILSAFAQLERENIKERTRMGMTERVKAGFWPGGGRVPFGYDYDPEKGILVPNSDAQTVRLIYNLYLSGTPMYKIAKTVGLKYERLAVQILKRKSNAGYIVYNGKEYKGRHEPIISEETYNEAMALMEERSKKRLTDSEYLLSGIVYCGVCGAKMRYQKWGKSGAKLCCYSKDKNKPYLVKDPDCDNENVWASEVEDAVVGDILELSYKIEKGALPEADITGALSAKKLQCEKKLKRLYSLYAADGDEVLKSAIAEVKKELEKAEAALSDEKKKEAEAKKREGKRKKLETLKDTWEFMTEKEKRNIVRSLVSKVTVTHDTMKIEYLL